MINKLGFINVLCKYRRHREIRKRVDIVKKNHASGCVKRDQQSKEKENRNRWMKFEFNYT